MFLALEKFKTGEWWQLHWAITCYPLSYKITFSRTSFSHRILSKWISYIWWMNQRSVTNVLFDQIHFPIVYFNISWKQIHRIVKYVFSNGKIKLGTTSLGHHLLLSRFHIKFVFPNFLQPSNTFKKVLLVAFVFCFFSTVCS